MHSRPLQDGDTDDKLVGVYATHQDAEAAIQRLKNKPGFKDTVDAFLIEEYAIGRDGWTEGFVTVE